MRDDDQGADMRERFVRRTAGEVGGDRIRAEGIVYALRRACREDLIDLTPSDRYLRLIDLLKRSITLSDTGKELPASMVSELAALGVERRDATKGHWTLVISKDGKENLRLRTATALASNGYVFVEAYHQIRHSKGFAAERTTLLRAIEKTARELLKYPDENGDGRYGWGRLWFKGADADLLHSSDESQNMHFGGYTYFPRVDDQGRSICERSAPLKEEAFDQSHVGLFLIEAYLVTRDRPLAQRIVRTVSKALFDTLDAGAAVKLPAGEGWNYWKQIGASRGTGKTPCDVGYEVKNTNLRMGITLLAMARIVGENQQDLGPAFVGQFDADKMRERGQAILRTENEELLRRGNFGYRGVASRTRELADGGARGRLVYDRTQRSLPLTAKGLEALNSLIADAAVRGGSPKPDSVIVCGGMEGDPRSDWDVAGSCWNHLGFEAEDYFRLARFTDMWVPGDCTGASLPIDAIARVLAASNLLHNGRSGVFKHYFPKRPVPGIANETVNTAFYGFFCMARNVAKHCGASLKNDGPSYRFLSGLEATCGAMPAESDTPGPTWRKGYKFFELYLEADRFNVEPDDWSLQAKH